MNLVFMWIPQVVISHTMWSSHSDKGRTCDLNNCINVECLLITNHWSPVCWLSWSVYDLMVNLDMKHQAVVTTSDHTGQCQVCILLVVYITGVLEYKHSYTHTWRRPHKTSLYCYICQLINWFVALLQVPKTMSVWL